MYIGYRNVSCVLYLTDTAAYYVHWYDEAYELLIECYEITKSYEILKEYRSRHMGWKWISEDNMRLVSLLP